MAKDLEMGYLLDFYGEVLTEKQREMLRQYYNDDFSLSGNIGENFGITRQGARDAIKHGETTLKELEEKVGFAARYRPGAAEAGRAGTAGDRRTVRVHGPQRLPPPRSMTDTPDKRCWASSARSTRQTRTEPKGAAHNGI